MGREGPAGTTGSYFSLINRQLRGLRFIPKPWKQPFEGHQSQDRKETRAAILPEMSILALLSTDEKLPSGKIGSQISLFP